MMKDLGIIQEQSYLEENMSNLTSSAISGEAAASASISSANNNINNNSATHIYTDLEQYFVDPTTNDIQQPPAKKKRNLPGNPDPNAEVIALSPKSLLATNRFMCEICNKGFQRDQNLQLHRRGHNLPWKLKQRSSKEVIRKKVYVCPEIGCVHNDPSRALGDLTGIKKHFSRKHGEKKWKCEKCSKKYAVQSDWKAHSKTCGTREYRCDCGTLFSRRDSFITHRAFCDALAEESARTTPSSISNLPFLSPPPVTHPTLPHHPITQLPPWLSCPPPPPHTIFSPSPLDHHNDLITTHRLDHEIKPPDHNPYQHQPITSPHMSATALLQKAAQIGATISNPKATSFALNLTPFHLQGNNDPVCAGAPPPHSHSQLIHDMMSSLSSSTRTSPLFIGSSPNFDQHHDAICGDILSDENAKKEGNLVTTEEGMTRDFLGLRPISNCDFLSFSDHINGHEDHYHA